MRLLLLRGMVALVVAAAAVGLAPPVRGRRCRPTCLPRNADAGGAGRVTAAGACRPARGYHPKPVRIHLECVPALGPREQHVGRPGTLAALRRSPRWPVVHRRAVSARHPEWSVTAGADNIGYRDQRMAHA